jgi:peptidoglycan/xylan/chitin deacetylase (PgdA/CDA1 family)
MRATAYFTVDVEQDCPPFLNTWRGIEEGMPRLLAMLDEERVRATFFTTGGVARRYPSVVAEIVRRGHELGCHGDTHRSFADMNDEEAEGEIADASAARRELGPVTSFRAPYLQVPPRYVPLLARHRYRLDSSEGRHKTLRASIRVDCGVFRIPASVTSLTLRWPSLPRNLLFARLKRPVVLFVHPWEFVDLRRERLRFDCRVGTGARALECARSTLRFFKARGLEFGLMRDVAFLNDGSP